MAFNSKSGFYNIKNPSKDNSASFNQYLVQQLFPLITNLNKIYSLL